MSDYRKKRKDIVYLSDFKIIANTINKHIRIFINDKNEYYDFNINQIENIYILFENFEFKLSKSKKNPEKIEEKNVLPPTINDDDVYMNSNECKQNIRNFQENLRNLTNNLLKIDYKERRGFKIYHFIKKDNLMLFLKDTISPIWSVEQFNNENYLE